MGFNRAIGLILILLTPASLGQQFNTTKTHEATVNEHPNDPRKLTFAFPEEDADYDENYYKDVGNISDLQNRTYNRTNNSVTNDDEDSTNADYLDELGSTSEDAFQNLNPDPYLNVHYSTNQTTLMPTTTTQEIEIPQVDFEMNRPSITLTHNVPNYSNDTLPKCPDGFETYENDSGAIICYTKTSATTYPPTCPHPNYLDSHTLPHHLTGSVSFWAKPPTKTFDNFGAAFVTSSWKYTPNYTECAITLNSNITPTSCNEPHPSICAYTYEDTQNLFDSYCKNKFNDTCVAANLGSGDKCYCKVQGTTSSQERNTFCNKLAEPLEPYQNALLLKTLSPNDLCWIGFKQDLSGAFKWSSTDSLTNYTYWSFTTDFTKTYGGISESAWSLETDGDLSCAICEIDINDHPNVQLNIKHKKSTNKIVLNVFNPVEAFGGIKCYSYSNEYHVNPSSETVEVDVFEVNDIPRYYWCKTLQLPHLTPIYSNRILAYINTGNSGHEYAITNHAEIPNSPYFMSQSIFNETGNVLQHIHTVPSNYTIQEETEFLTNFISANVKSSEICLPSTTVSNNITLNWEATAIGATVLPDVLCLQDNGNPVTRTCSGNFLYGSHWENVIGDCVKVSEINATLLYDDLLRFGVQSHTIAEIYTVIKFVENTTNFIEFLQGINNIMHYPVSNVKETQYLLNATDGLLDVLKDRLNQRLEASVLLNHVTVSVANLTSTSTLGFKNSFEAVDINNDTDLTHFDVIVRLSEQFLDELNNCSSILPSPSLTVAILNNDAFFGEEHNSHEVTGNIYFITIPNSSQCNLSSNIELLIKTKTKTDCARCASWQYGHNDLMENTHGRWNIEHPTSTEYEVFQRCAVQHSSYYSILENSEQITTNNIDPKALLILGAIVSAVAVLIVIGILTTMIVYKSRSYNHIAVVNLAVSTAAQLILSFSVILFKIDGVACIVIAVLLHLTTLSQFIWHLIIAWSQHNFYLKHKEQNEQHTLQTFCLAWGLPILIVVVIVSISNTNYGKIANDICYPMGNNFTYSVVLLVSVLLLAISILYLKITASIKYSRKVKTHHIVKETSFSQLKLGVMLYLLLGITWGLGILTAVVERTTVPYIYAIVACTQEVVIFLLFIVLNEQTRDLWVSVKNVCCMGKSNGYELTPRKKGRKPKYSTSYL